MASFYGNISNTARTSFQFDRTYANRVEMENAKSTDGVYAGRYVLVEYDTSISSDVDKGTLDHFQRIFPQAVSGKDKVYYGYTDPNLAGTTRIKNSEVEEGAIFYSANITYDPLQVTGGYTFYKALKGTDTYAEFVWVTDSESNYVKNYNIDTAKYGEGRGYDSTVWQKAYVDNAEKYIMIAELNTVVPTFDISADAPTLSPITPHFDINSTDVYYKLHWQPQWGLRIKENSSDVTDSLDKTKYPSDETVNYTVYNYDVNTGVETKKDYSYDGAIYYNKAGFDKEVRTHVDGTDKIAVTPTGLSGNLYNAHKGDTSTEKRPDIQELSIILPSLGNLMSEIWDMIYGTESMTGGEKRNLDTAWDSTEGLRMIQGDSVHGFTYDTEAIETVAACINSVHDLMGMIIVDGSGNDEDKIYYRNGKYYMVEHAYSYITTTDLTTDEDLYVVADTSGILDVGAKWNKNVTTIPDGVLLGTRKDIIQQKELKGFGRSLNTIHGLILQINKILMTDSLTRDRSTVQGCINIMNDIINIYDNLVPEEIIIVDNYGRVHSSPWTTALKFSASNTQNGVTSTLADSEPTENKWIYLDVDGDVENPKITLEHRFTKVKDTTSTSDKNKVENSHKGENTGADDDLKLYTPIVDAMGHVVGLNTETVTLPYGFKFIKTNGLDADSTSFKTSTAATETITATETKDTFNIDSGNKWVIVDIPKDDKKVVVSHEVHSIDENPADATDLNGEKAPDTFVVYDVTSDRAGHITGNKSHLYTLPAGFKFIKTNGRGTDTSINATTSPATNITITADNAKDTLLLNSGNKWVRIDAVDGTTNSLTFSHDIHSINTTAVSDTDLNDNGDKITLQDITYDTAGHITANKAHTYILPYGFKNVEVKEASSGVDNGAANAATIKANNTLDTLIISPSNKWIRVSANAGTDTISIGHEVLDEISTTTTTTDLEKLSTIAVPELTYDVAGHLTALNTNTYTLQNSIRNVKVTGSSATTTALDGDSDTKTIEAIDYKDTLEVVPGNRWISLKSDTDNRKLTIGHKGADTTDGNNTTAGETGNASIEFGEKFVTPYVNYDKTGHISSSGTRSVTLPLPSLNKVSTTTASVLTGLSLTDTTGALTQTYSNVGTRVLTGYSQGNDSSSIAASDTINAAFAKLLNLVTNEVSNRETAVSNAIQTEVTNRNTEISNLIEALNISSYLKTDTTTFTYQNKSQILLDIITSIEDRLTAIEETLASAT